MTWATSVPILVFLGLSVLDLGPMYATDRQADVRRQTKASLNASALGGRRHNNNIIRWRSVQPYSVNKDISCITQFLLYLKLTKYVSCKRQPAAVIMPPPLIIKRGH